MDIESYMHVFCDVPSCTSWLLSNPFVISSDREKVVRYKVATDGAAFLAVKTGDAMTNLDNFSHHKNVHRIHKFIATTNDRSAEWTPGWPVANYVDEWSPLGGEVTVQRIGELTVIDAKYHALIAKLPDVEWFNPSFDEPVYFRSQNDSQHRYIGAVMPLCQWGDVDRKTGKRTSKPFEFNLESGQPERSAIGLN